MAPVLGIWASSFNSRTFQPTGSYDALATYTVPSGGVASVTFAGLPTGGQYSHLQLRILGRSASGSFTGGSTGIRLNGDTGSNYAAHFLLGDGSSTSAYGWSNEANMYGYTFAGGTATSGVFAGLIIDILDFASASKNKTLRTLSGVDNNGNGEVRFSSGLWRNTNPVNSITIDGRGENYVQYSQFALYGVKG